MTALSNLVFSHTLCKQIFFNMSDLKDEPSIHATVYKRKKWNKMLDKNYAVRGSFIPLIGTENYCLYNNSKTHLMRI